MLSIEQFRKCIKRHPKWIRLGCAKSPDPSLQSNRRHPKRWGQPGNVKIKVRSFSDWWIWLLDRILIYDGWKSGARVPPAHHHQAVTLAANAQRYLKRLQQFFPCIHVYLRYMPTCQLTQFLDCPGRQLAYQAFSQLLQAIQGNLTLNKASKSSLVTSLTWRESTPIESSERLSFVLWTSMFKVRSLCMSKLGNLWYFEGKWPVSQEDWISFEDFRWCLVVGSSRQFKC